MTTLVLHNQAERTAELAEQWQAQIAQHVGDQLQHQLSYPLLVDQLNQDAIQTGQLPVDAVSLDAEAVQQYFWRQLQQLNHLTFTGFASEQGRVIAVERQRDQRTAIFEINLVAGESAWHYQVVGQGHRGALMTSVDSSDWFGTQWLIADWQHQPWFQTATQTTQPRWLTVSSGRHQSGLVAIQPVYQGDKRLGFLFAGISLNGLNQMLQNIQKGRDSKVFILERTGALIATAVNGDAGQRETALQKSPPREAAVAHADPAIQQAVGHLQSRAGKSFSFPHHFRFHSQGQSFYGQLTAYGDEPGLDWLIGVVTPAATFSGQIAPTSKRLWLLCLLPLVVILLTTRYLSRRIAQPLLQMGEASQKIAQGQFQIQIPVGRVKELATLAVSFNQMAQEVFQSRRSLERYSSILEQRVAERTTELEQEICRRKAIEAVLHQANQELERLAFMDGLTQIANRRHFNDRLNQEWVRLKRMQAPLSLILCDIDHFKQYNDTCGHLAGDECLRQVATLLRTPLKHPADLVARYGGEEFALILPETPEAGAVQVVQKIQTHLQRQQIDHPSSPVSSYVTLSLGIATVVPHADMSFHDLIDCADRALYEAKSKGRNGYVVGNLCKVPSLNGFSLNCSNPR